MRDDLGGDAGALCVVVRERQGPRPLSHKRQMNINVAARRLVAVDRFRPAEMAFQNVGDELDVGPFAQCVAIGGGVNGSEAVDACCVGRGNGITAAPWQRGFARCVVLQAIEGETRDFGRRRVGCAEIVFDAILRVFTWSSGGIPLQSTGLIDLSWSSERAEGITCGRERVGWGLKTFRGRDRRFVPWGCSRNQHSQATRETERRSDSVGGGRQDSHSHRMKAGAKTLYAVGWSQIAHHNRLATAANGSTSSGRRIVGFVLDVYRRHCGPVVGIPDARSRHQQVPGVIHAPEFRSMLLRCCRSPRRVYPFS